MLKTLRKKIDEIEKFKKKIKNNQNALKKVDI